MLLWIILLTPLISFALISLLYLKRPACAACISIGTAVINAGLTVYAVAEGAINRAPTISGLSEGVMNHAPTAEGTMNRTPVITWLSVGDLHIEIGLLWDHLSQLMLLIVTCVGALIHIYSWGYMRGDPGKGRYFAFLSLFMFSMLGIVLAGNFVMMFIFWELVGLSSYLLIGFWFEKPNAVEAGKKAFIVNRIGDFGFMLGIILVWHIWGTVDFQALASNAGQLLSQHQTSDYFWIPLRLVALLLFCGAVGKSAQFPLHVWLPDAMEGPTPVSALIHAATMVAAGVYMLCRIFFLLSLSSTALTVIAWTGGITALLAALWAIAQDDIKRILACSTLSQLGYMVMAVGLMGPVPAMFHLSTHAFFKALLFLAAGSVIVALHHEQNIWRMGGLRSRMPWTCGALIVGLAALCGIPFFSGALSKDEILMLALRENKPLFAIAACTAFLTAFYMGRLFMVVFLGDARGEEAGRARENGPVMLIPLCILALCSVSWVWPTTLIDESLKFIGGFQRVHTSAGIHFLLVLIPFMGLAAAFGMYRNQRVDVLATLAPRLRNLLASRFCFDELYAAWVQRIQGAGAECLRLVDEWIVDRLCVKGVSLVILCSGNAFRCFQTGNLQTYVILLGFGLVGLIYWVLFR